MFKNVLENTQYAISDVYMPQKPNLNGLLLYVLSTVSATTDLPFTLYIDSFVKQPQPSPEQAFLKCRESMKQYYDFDMHYTADAAFIQADLFENITTEKVTVSCSSTHFPYLWNVLTYKLKL
jgi:hypothetical protein